jgi:hypothetical protein
MCICQDCGRFIDSDIDPDCFVETKYEDRIVCDDCRQEDKYYSDLGDAMAAQAEDRQ